MAEGTTMKVVRDVHDVPDGQPYVLIKLGGQRKRGGKYFKYNGQPLTYPVNVSFQISFYKPNETKGTIKYVDSKTYNAVFWERKLDWF